MGRNIVHVSVEGLSIFAQSVNMNKWGQGWEAEGSCRGREKQGGVFLEKREIGDKDGDREIETETLMRQ